MKLLHQIFSLGIKYIAVENGHLHAEDKINEENNNEIFLKDADIMIGFFYSIAST